MQNGRETMKPNNDEDDEDDDERKERRGGGEEQRGEATWARDDGEYLVHQGAGRALARPLQLSPSSSLQEVAPSSFWRLGWGRYEVGLSLEKRGSLALRNQGHLVLIIR